MIISFSYRAASDGAKSRHFVASFEEDIVLFCLMSENRESFDTTFACRLYCLSPCDCKRFILFQQPGIPSQSAMHESQFAVSLMHFFTYLMPFRFLRLVPFIYLAVNARPPSCFKCSNRHFP
jgi:hypothetical protein